MCKEDDPKFEVESVLFNNGPNIVTFQLAARVQADCPRGFEYQF